MSLLNTVKLQNVADKILILVLLCLFFQNTNATQNKNDLYVCVRWTWKGDVFERKVICLEWKPLDCSNRMYPEICRTEGVKK